MNFSYKGYVRYLRKQHVHVQKIHAATFAGIISLTFFAAVLYLEYGYWDVKYERAAEAEKLSKQDSTVLKESPTESLARLIAEGKTRFTEAVSTLEPLRGGGTTFDRSQENRAQ